MFSDVFNSFVQILLLDARDICEDLLDRVEANLAFIPGVSMSVTVLGQEINEIWDRATSLSEGSKLVRLRFLTFQREYLSESAKTAQQKAVLTTLGQQAHLAASVASSSARGGRNLQEFWPALPLPPVANSQGGGSRPGSRQGSPGRQPNVCDSWRKTQTCPRGAACRFAASHVPL